ncbi:MAG: baseplate J/gp47 family protein [Chloroflexota bacterium]
MTLVRPDFIERSPTIIEPEVIAAFETALGKQLFPGQLERLLLNVAVYRELRIRIGIQSAAEQNLVNYATGTNLDQLGALLAVTRLAASAATVTLQLSRAGTTGNLVIPTGSTARQPGSSVLFATDAEVTISDGQSSIQVTATATTMGASTSGFSIGTITQIVSAPSEVISVTNTAASSGGADAESDEAFRARIKLAPNQFSVAGSKGAYKFHTLSVDSSIIDVAVLGPEDRNGANPVTVDVYPLLNTGLPGQPLLDSIADTLDLDTIRPLTDIVNVAAPPEVNYTITAHVTILDSADQATVQAALDAEITEYTTAQSSQLGLDVVRSQIISTLHVDGVYSVELVSPAADIVLAPNEWPNVTTATVSIVGTNDG